MKAATIYFAFLVLLFGCLEKPKPWEPPDWQENQADVAENDNARDVNGKDVSDTMGEACAMDGETDQADEGADKHVDESSDEGTDHLDNGTDEGMDEHTDKADVIDVPDLDIVDQAEAPDAKDCPPGYSWDAEKQKCVSFCPADKYYEQAVGQCLFYPCCDLSGDWKLSVLDSDTMKFTIYELGLGQTISYVDAFLELDSPPESAACSGTVQKKSFVLTCVNETYSLQLSSSTVKDDGSFSGFYTYNYKDGAVKSGPFNIDKK